MSCSVRRALPKDIERIMDLLSQVLEVHAQARPDIFISGTRKYSREELLELIADDKRPVFVAIDDNDYVQGHAFCILEESKGCNNLRDMLSLYIDDICVDESCRGCGIATLLYRHVQDYARQLGCYHITLNVWEINPGAKAFYEKMGMQPLKTVMECIL